MDNDEKNQILLEGPMSLAGLARELGCSYAKVYKLAKSGRADVSGKVVKLGTIKTESGLSSSLAAYRRFQLELNGSKVG